MEAPLKKVLSSTILIYNGKWHVGRLGAIPPEAFEPILGYLPSQAFSSQPLCPGQQFRHYSPKARLHLGGDFSQAKIILGFTDRTYPSHARLISWGPSHSPNLVLRALYTALRQLDQEQIDEAWVDIDVPKEQLWNTFLERLHKASFS